MAQDKDRAEPSRTAVNRKPPQGDRFVLGFGDSGPECFSWTGKGVNSPQVTDRRVREQAAPWDTPVLCLTHTRVLRGTNLVPLPGYAGLAAEGTSDSDTETVDPPEWSQLRTETVGHLISGDTALRSVL